MVRTLTAAALAVAATVLLFAAAPAVSRLTAVAAPTSGVSTRAAPEFTHTGAEQWLNSAPLSLRALRGQVVLLDIWTTDCWNCYRSFPWLKRVIDRYGGRGLVTIGVHSPEFEREKNRSAIQARLAHYDLTNPQMLDDDFSYWNMLGNRFWPAFYLIDKHGRIREMLVGEQHHGDRSAAAFEQRIDTLLREPN